MMSGLHDAGDASMRHSSNNGKTGKARLQQQQRPQASRDPTPPTSTRHIIVVQGKHTHHAVLLDVVLLDCAA